MRIDLKKLFVGKPAKSAYPVNWGYANFQKMVWMRIICIPCIIVIHTIFWKFSKLRLTSPSGPIRYSILRSVFSWRISLIDDKTIQSVSLFPSLCKCVPHYQLSLLMSEHLWPIVHVEGSFSLPFQSSTRRFYHMIMFFFLLVPIDLPEKFHIQIPEANNTKNEVS